MIEDLDNSQVCQYTGCEIRFFPKRRRTRKFCSDACRVLACRERKNGIGGTLHDKPRSKGMNDLYTLAERQHHELTLNHLELRCHNQELQKKYDFLVAQQNYLNQIFVALTFEIGKMKGEFNLVQKDLEYKLIAKLEILKTDLKPEKYKFEIAEIMNQLKSIDSQFNKLLELSIDIRKKQNFQDSEIIISSTFGPRLGDKIIKFIKGN